MEKQHCTYQNTYYEGLLEAIELFSQKLTANQVFDYAFDYLKKMLFLRKGAVYVKKEQKFFLHHIDNYQNLPSILCFTDRINEIATFHGRMLFPKDIKKYLGEDFLAEHPKDIVIPFIVEDYVLGFIVAEFDQNFFDPEHYIIIETLMKLFNSSLSNFEGYAALQTANKQLDEKIFNLFAINQSSKILLSELNLNRLYSLSIDVFSELTQSAITGFILYEPKSESFTLKTMRNVFYPMQKVSLQLRLNKDCTINPHRILLDLSCQEDLAYFESLFFRGIEKLLPLEPLYIVLLINQGELLGFVTLGENVTQKPYEKSIFELIESLSYSTYIALSNAKHVEKVNHQKIAMENKLYQLLSLNQLVKTINSALDIDSLCELTLKTLEISFGLHKGFIGLYDKAAKCIKLVKLLNFETCEDSLPISSSWEPLFEGDMIIESVEERAKYYFQEAFLQDVKGHAGVLLAPIMIERLEKEFIGVIGIFKYHNLLIADEENMLIVDSVANHIAPTLFQYIQRDLMKEQNVLDYRKQFINAMESYIEEAEELKLDLYVVHIHMTGSSLFSSPPALDLLREKYSELYPITPHHILLIDNFDIEKDIKKILASEREVQISSFALRRDYTHIHELLPKICS